MKFCECGCGTLIHSIDNQGRSIRFKSGHSSRDKHPSELSRQKMRLAKLGKKLSKQHCSSLSKSLSGYKNPAWKGGRIHDAEGYILIWKPDHPFHNNDNYVREHRLVYEQFLGRYLTKEEEIHHINGKKDDNRIENLQKYSKSEHTTLHQKKDLSKRTCSGCPKINTRQTKKGHFLWYKNPNLLDSWYCDNCYRKYKRRLKNK